jgi:hypothetical protein
MAVDQSPAMNPDDDRPPPVAGRPMDVGLDLQFARRFVGMSQFLGLCADELRKGQSEQDRRRQKPNATNHRDLQGKYMLDGV